MESDRQTTFRFLAEPTDVNFGGKVHGGAVMKWLDQTAYACAAGWSKAYCVTVFVSGIHFLQPIFIGNMVEINARVIYTGHSSIHIALEVKSRAPTDDEYVVNTHCNMVFVALDSEGRKIKVPKWEPVSEKDKTEEKYALELKEVYTQFENVTKKLTNH